MDEIKVRKNTLGLKVYVNGLPNFKLMPKNILEILLVEIERIFRDQKKVKKY